MREHEWQGSWNRPVKVDEGSYDALTIARMTDHNVRGRAESDEAEINLAAAKPIGIVTAIEVDLAEVTDDIIDPDER
jgi:hypothetical protein